MTILDKAVKDFTTMMRNGTLEGIVLYDLVESYKHNEDDWEMKDALRKVIKWYATPDQYEEFKKEVGI